MDTIDTPFGTITREEVVSTRFVAGQRSFETEGEARAELRRLAFSDVLLNFARWVVALQGDIPEENVREVLPILRKVRESGLDYAAMTAALEGREWTWLSASTSLR